MGKRRCAPTGVGGNLTRGPCAVPFHWKRLGELIGSPTLRHRTRRTLRPSGSSPAWAARALGSEVTASRHRGDVRGALPRSLLCLPTTFLRNLTLLLP